MTWYPPDNDAHFTLGLRELLPMLKDNEWRNRTRKAKKIDISTTTRRRKQPTPPRAA